jgi:DGQHR domain-containing protein
MKVLRRRALCIEQTKSGPLYLFTLRADEIFDVAEVTRVNRSRSNELIGYQRAEVRQHVDDILEYLNGDDVLFPNTLIFALTPNVRFRRSRGPENDDGLAKAGMLEIPLAAEGGEPPAWIVDGQQRALALARAERRDLPVPISAFVAETVTQQRDQFLRINNAKPLPRGLVAELLPEVAIPLPRGLAAKQVPSEICGLLNDQSESPFRGLIRRASTPRGSGAVITDTSVIEMLRESLSSPSGCLFPYRNLATGETDFEAIWRVLVTYWSGVRDAFPEAWGRPPEESRLMHGVGIRAMGRLMDKVMGAVYPADPDLAEHVARAMGRIAPSCHWTTGTWDELSLRWNDVENTNRNQRLLANLLVRLYFGGAGAR